TVTVPDHVDGSEPDNTFNLYESLKFSYWIPGPKSYSPSQVSLLLRALTEISLVGFWLRNSSETRCYAQGNICFNSAPPTRPKSRYVWNNKMCMG
ncbi:hypothetical protein LY78DRAFT_593718, partial [Colletotrichum sublineola]